jgi:flagellar assembly protein FliH
MMKQPNFMQGVAPSTSAPRRASEVPAGAMRAVSWAAAPSEHAAPLPMQTLSGPAAVIRPALVAPPSVPVPPPGFEVLGSASPPAPLPPVPLPPPAPSPITPAPAGLSPLVEAAIARLRLQGERLAEQARSDALEVGLMVARRILERELSANVESLFALIKSAIRKAGEAHTTVVRLNPADLARLKDSAETAFTLGRVELAADEALQPGDVMVDADQHTIDGRLSTRLMEAARALDDQEP